MAINDMGINHINVYLEAFKHLPIEVHVWQLIRDETGRIISWKLVDANPKALKAWGKCLEDVNDKRTEEIFLDSDPIHQFMPIVERIFATNEPYVWQEYFPSTKQTLEMKSVPFGEHFISIGRDVSDRLRKEREQRDIFAATDVGVFRYEPINNILEWDESMYALYELEKDKFSGAYDAWSSSLHPDYAKIAQQELQDAIDGKKNFDTTFAIMTGQGRKKFIRAKATIDRDSEGKAIFIHGINMDKTAEVEAQNELERERLKLMQTSKLATLGELAAGIAHEINNPLMIISGCSAIMQKKELSIEKTKNHLEKIQRAVDRIAKITLGLKKFSRSSHELNRKPHNLAKLIEESLDLLNPKLIAHNLKINNQTDKDLEIFADEIQLEQVIINLVSNAIDAVSEKEDAWIKIFTKTDQKWTEIYVMDSGTGIIPAVLDHLFDPFYTTKNVGKGTGLGLSISKSIALDHGGDLEYQLIDGHTTFVLKIPKSE